MPAAASRQLIAFGPFEFDSASGLLYRGQQEILLPLRAGKVLEVLVDRPGDVLSKDELLGEVWKDAFVGEDSLTQAISMIRSALGDDPRDPTYIQTIPKRGYRFIARVTAEPMGGEEQPAEPVVTIPEGAAVARGESLGHYEILAELGSGAMGVVYRARDTVLEREVAIKLLPKDFVSDPGRVARFEREAKLLASVSHPNIAAIHSLEEADGTKFPVMELVEGETLEQRLRSGPIKMEDALEIARQIASALEAAHERGIVHRDLKPANIKLTPAGQVKVLDFGLAKALNVQVFGEGVSESPTESITIMGSRRGSIVGTAAYMSPEQARGQEVTKQADIWAFGCVLYEMLTGRRPFIGETVSDTIAGVLEREPEWGTLPPEATRSARRLLRRCLAKDPQRRIHDMADARIEIEETLGGPPEPLLSAASAVGSAPIWQRAIPWVVAAVALSIAAWSMSRPDTTVSRAPVRHLSINLPDTYRLRAGVEARSSIAISPDGSSVVYHAWAEGGGGALLLHRLEGSDDATPIPGIEGGQGPFFSPDGEWLGFFADNVLKKVPVQGGDAIQLAEVQYPIGAVWGADNTIIFTPAISSGLFRVSAAGGDPEPFTTLDIESGERDHSFPQLLPGGRAVLFTVFNGISYLTSNIAVGSLDTGEHRIVHGPGGHARYVPTGHLVYAGMGGLFAVPFDLETMETRGTPVTILRGIYTEPASDTPLFEISPSGDLVYAPGEPTLSRDYLIWINDQGEVTEVGNEPIRASRARLSPNGRQVVFALRSVGEGYDIFVHDLTRGTTSRLTTHPEWDHYPVWTPDGERVTFASARAGVFSIWWKTVGGTGEAEVLMPPSEHNRWPRDWSPDGRMLAYREDTSSAASDIWLLPIDGDQEPEPFATTEFDESGPVFSPDGRWIAYSSNESGRREVYVQPYPQTGDRWPVSTEGGRGPIWSRDGGELYYRNENGVWAVPIDTQTGYPTGRPEMLFGLERVGLHDIGLAPRHFLGGQAVPLPPVTQINIVLNWFEELKRLAPTER